MKALKDGFKLSLYSAPEFKISDSSRRHYFGWALVKENYGQRFSGYDGAIAASHGFDVQAYDHQQDAHEFNRSYLMAPGNPGERARTLVYLEDWELDPSAPAGSQDKTRELYNNVIDYKELDSVISQVSE